jgi:ribosomal protein S18 acetylase RimI-like enzyme
MDPLHDTFSVRVDVVIRPCAEADLPALEWFGLFASDRPLVRRIFIQHLRGDAVMLVVQANGEVSGQLWIEFAGEHAERTGVIWAVRVLPCLQRLGIGARLIGAAEGILLERGFERVELSVETGNASARRLYERLGYRTVGSRPVTARPGAADRGGRRQVVLAKELRAVARVCALEREESL